MDLTLLLKLLPAVGSAAARAPEFIAVYQQMMLALDPGDQETAKQALADIQADNDEGHARLQARLAAAGAALAMPMPDDPPPNDPPPGGG